MSRRRFKEWEVVETLLRQGAVIKCPRTGQIMRPGDEIEREHFHEIGLGGKDEIENCFYSLKAAHNIVTNGTKATTAGSSKHKIAKVKRLAQGGRKRRGRRIPSRPFAQVKRPFRKKGATMSLTIRRPIEEDLHRCRYCRFYTMTPTVTAPQGWKRCRLDKRDKHPNSTCSRHEPSLRQSVAGEHP